MFDKDLVREILVQILLSIETIGDRFYPVCNVNDLTDSKKGQEKLDGLCMQLIAIGESLKNLDKITDGKLLAKYPEIEWKKAMGMRDILTHHYFDIDAEIIYSVCENEIPAMQPVLHKMIQNL